MQIDEDQFFRQATLRISSSLDIEKAMKNCMSYLRQYIPISGMFFALYDSKLNMGRMLASLWPANMNKPKQTLSFSKKFWEFMKENSVSRDTISVVNDIDEELEHTIEAISQKKDVSKGPIMGAFFLTKLVNCRCRHR